MKTESTKPEGNKSETNKPDTKARSGSATASERGVVRVEVAVGDLVPDPENRAIDETDEDFVTLADSVRVMGVLVALQVQRRADGKIHIWDGERRWRAARRAGLATVPCDVWPDTAHPRDLVLAGVVINEQRQPHSCLAVARRLRAVKNQFAETHEQVAARTGLPPQRVKWYLNLFNASDCLLAFFEDANVALKTAAELVRYEKALGETATRRLLEQHRQEPMTCREIEAMRKRHERRAQDGTSAPADETAPARRPSGLGPRLVAAFRRDAVATRQELAAVVTQFGLRLVAADGAQGD